MREKDSAVRNFVNNDLPQRRLSCFQVLTFFSLSWQMFCFLDNLEVLSHELIYEHLAENLNCLLAGVVHYVSNNLFHCRACLVSG